ncbi:hypothetical protein ACFL5H_02875 [Candidatus Latescibacterota bacterium]
MANLPNYCKWENIKSALIQAFGYFDFSELKPYLWKDEINDVFLLTKHMEVYFYNAEVLACYCWSHKTMLLLRSKGLIFDIWGTDDGLYAFKTKIENLPFILTTGAFKRRPDVNGTWIRSREEKLGHRIFPFRPDMEEKEEVPIIKGIECREELCV